MTPIVFLHGFTGSPKSFQAITSQLGKDARVLAPALVGHEPRGESSAAPVVAETSPDVFECEVDRVAARITESGFGAVHVVGYSLGARIGLGLCVRHPELVARATLIGVHPGLASDAERAARRAADEVWAQRLEVEGLAAFIEAWQNQPIFATQARLPAEVRERQKRERLEHSVAGLARSLRTVGLAEMPSYWPALKELSVPVNLVVGALDDKFRALAVRALLSLRNAHLHLIPDCGHNVVLERPEAISALLEQEE